MDFLSEDDAGVVLAAGGKFYRINPDETVTQLTSVAFNQTYRLLPRATDGNYYGLPNRYSPRLVQVTPAGIATTITRDFTGDGGSIPSGALSRGLDGRLYGLTLLGGRDAAGTIFGFDPGTGTHAVVHSFAPAEGGNPSGNLAVDAAGNLHGMVPGALFRCSPAGEFAVRAALPVGSAADRPLLWSTTGRVALGADGALYAFVPAPKESLYRLGADGVLKKTATLASAFQPSELSTGADGALYFTQNRANSTGYLPGLFGRVSVPAGAVSVRPLKGAAPILLYGRLALGANGDLFGFDGSLGIFRLATDGRGTALRGLEEEDVLGWGTNGLLRASDDRFYSLFFGVNYEGTSARIVRAIAAGADGGYRILGTFPWQRQSASVGPLEYFGSQNYGAALVEASDGFLYGTLPSGGGRGGGVIFRFPRVTENTAPVAADDDFEFIGSEVALHFIRGNPKSPLLANDSDPDGDRLVVRSTTAPGHGKVVTLYSEFLAYVPDKSFHGIDTFSYTVSDGLGGEATAKVTVRNPFLNSVGTYSGVLTGTDGVAYATFEIKLDSFGLVNGKFTILPPNPHARSLRLYEYLALGTHDISYDVAATGDIPGYHHTAQLTGEGELLLTVTEGTAVYSATVTRRAKSLPPDVAAGKYTLRLPAPSGADTLPGGDGFALCTMSAKGLLRATGVLPDGAAFTLGGTLSEDGELSFFLPLYTKPKGSLAGSLDFTAAGTTHQIATVHWAKPAQVKPGTQLYPGGFDTVLAIDGASYVPPVKGVSALHGGSLPVKYDFTANLDAAGNTFKTTFLIDAADKLPTTPLPGKLALTLNRTTGLVTGSFLDPATGTKRTLRGAILQSTHTAEGLFLDATGVHSFTLEIAPP